MATQLRCQNFRGSRAQAQLARLRDVLRAAGLHDVGAQFRFGLVVADVAAGVDVADAAPGRQADVPDPAGALRGGAGLRGDRVLVGRVGDLHRQRRVVVQHVLLRDQRDAVVLAQQQRLHAGAVDEQVAFERAVLFASAARRYRRCRAN
jgi:hypothetical protein